MILGVGVDLADHPRVARVYARYPEAYLARVLTPGERARCLERSDPVPCLASRFAAKEAVAKALGVGIARLGLRNVEVASHPSGAPYLTLLGRPGAWAAAQPGLRLHLSLSDVPGLSVALVVVEADVPIPLPPTW